MGFLSLIKSLLPSKTVPAYIKADEEAQEQFRKQQKENAANLRLIAEQSEEKQKELIAEHHKQAEEVYCCYSYIKTTMTHAEERVLNSAATLVSIRKVLSEHSLSEQLRQILLQELRTRNNKLDQISHCK